MDDNLDKQAKYILASAAIEGLKEIRNELENLERKTAEISEILHRDGQVRKENADFVGSEVDNIMMALLREQAKHDPELAAQLKEYVESENKIS